MSAIQSFLLKFAVFFGVGKMSRAPGTWGTLATIPLALGLSLLGPIPYMIFVLLLLPVAILAAQAYEKFSDSHDAKEIVIDEVVGFLITMTWMPMTWQAYFVGFVLFRFLDILKPPPIRYFDKRVPGGLGVVMDDVVAGLIANLFMQILYSQTSWLGVQFITFS